MLSFLFHKYIAWIMGSSPVLKAVLGVWHLATFLPLVAIVAAFSYCPMEVTILGQCESICAVAPQEWKQHPCDDAVAPL